MSFWLAVLISSVTPGSYEQEVKNPTMFTEKAGLMDYLNQAEDLDKRRVYQVAIQEFKPLMEINLRKIK